MTGYYICMVAWRGRSDPLRLMGRRLILVALAILVIFVSGAAWNIYRKDKEAAQLREQAETQLADLEERQARLTEDYEKLKTERGLEAALREQYAVGAAGEELIIIVEPERPEPVQATSSVLQWIKDVFSHW